MPRGLQARFRVPLFAVLITSSIAATAGVASAVTGGTDANLPFLARIVVGDNVRACSGVLVEPRLVLTSTGCFTGSDGKAHSGRVGTATTATVGSVTAPVSQISVHGSRNVVLAYLATPVRGETVAIGTTAPAAGDELTLAGFGRTATEWVPDKAKSAVFKVGAVAAGTLDVAPGDTTAAGLCKGDAGGPALRKSGASYQVVAVNYLSNQAGCVGEAAGAAQAQEIRVDDLGAWVRAGLPGFHTGVDAGETELGWINTPDNLLNVLGVTGTTGPELFIGTNPGKGVHSGNQALLYSGKDNSDSLSYAYMKAFDLGNLPVRADTVLSYWFRPQDKTESLGHAVDNNSTCVGVDLNFDDNTFLRDLGLTDQNGIGAHPAAHCNKFKLNEWHEVILPIGKVAAGKKISMLTIGYDQPGLKGGYRGFIDDISISDDQYFAGSEDGDPGLVSNNTVAEDGGLSNVGGLCCNLTGPELFHTDTPAGHTGKRMVMYSGKATSSSNAWAYMLGFRPEGVYVTPSTRLTYWIYPQSSAEFSSGVVDGNSTCVAVDLIFEDPATHGRQNLRDRNATDSHGNSIHPRSQCGKLTMNTWNQVSVPLSAVAQGQEIVQIDIGYEQPNKAGGYRGFIDDIRITQ